MTTTTADACRARAVALVRDGAVTFVLVLLSFAAFDDITTGHETDLTLEYGTLLVVAGWLSFVTFRLIRASHRVLGAMSIVVLAGALWGQLEIGPGITPGLWPAYVVTASAFLWFIAVAVVLLVSGWRAHPEWHAQGS
jgi:hypothetical protein